MGVIYLLYHKDFVERMRNQYPPGTRVEVISLCNEEEHLKPGMKGTVVGVDDQPALLVDWDNGSSLSLLIGKDHFRVVPQQEEAPGITMQLKKPIKRKKVVTYPIYHSMGRRETGPVPHDHQTIPNRLPEHGLCGSVRGRRFRSSQQRTVRP